MTEAFLVLLDHACVFSLTVAACDWHVRVDEGLGFSTGLCWVNWGKVTQNMMDDGSDEVSRSICNSMMHVLIVQVFVNQWFPCDAAGSACGCLCTRWRANLGSKCCTLTKRVTENCYEKERSMVLWVLVEQIESIFWTRHLDILDVWVFLHSDC